MYQIKVLHRSLAKLSKSAFLILKVGAYQIKKGGWGGDEKKEILNVTSWRETWLDFSDNFSFTF